MIAQIVVYKSQCKYYRKHADADRPDSELSHYKATSSKSSVTELYFIVCLWYNISDGNGLTTGHTSAGLKRAPRNVCSVFFSSIFKGDFSKAHSRENFQWVTDKHLTCVDLQQSPLLHLPLLLLSFRLLFGYPRFPLLLLRLSSPCVLLHCLLEKKSEREQTIEETSLKRVNVQCLVVTLQCLNIFSVVLHI